MSDKICPLMSWVSPANEAKVVEVLCYEKDCQMWEAQTGTCGLVTGGILAGRTAVIAEMKDK